MGDGLGTHFLSIKNHGHAEQIVTIPNSPYPQWTKIEITNIPIYTGSCEIGVYSNAPAGSWCSADNLVFVLQN